MAAPLEHPDKSAWWWQEDMESQWRAGNVPWGSAFNQASIVLKNCKADPMQILFKYGKVTLDASAIARVKKIYQETLYDENELPHMNTSVLDKFTSKWNTWTVAKSFTGTIHTITHRHDAAMYAAANAAMDHAEEMAHTILKHADLINRDIREIHKGYETVLTKSIPSGKMIAVDYEMEIALLAAQTIAQSKVLASIKRALERSFPPTLVFRDFLSPATCVKMDTAIAEFQLKLTAVVSMEQEIIQALRAYKKKLSKQTQPTRTNVSLSDTPDGAAYRYMDDKLSSVERGLRVWWTGVQMIDGLQYPEVSFETIRGSCSRLKDALHDAMKPPPVLDKTMVAFFQRWKAIRGQEGLGEFPRLMGSPADAILEQTMPGFRVQQRNFDALCNEFLSRGRNALTTLHQGEIVTRRLTRDLTERNERNQLWTPLQDVTFNFRVNEHDGLSYNCDALLKFFTEEIAPGVTRLVFVGDDTLRQARDLITNFRQAVDTAEFTMHQCYEVGHCHIVRSFELQASHNQSVEDPSSRIAEVARNEALIYSFDFSHLTTPILRGNTNNKKGDDEWIKHICQYAVECMRGWTPGVVFDVATRKVLQKWIRSTLPPAKRVDIFASDSLLFRGPVSSQFVHAMQDVGTHTHNAQRTLVMIWTWFERLIREFPIWRKRYQPDNWHKHRPVDGVMQFAIFFAFGTELVRMTSAIATPSGILENGYDEFDFVRPVHRDIYARTSGMIAAILPAIRQMLSETQQFFRATPWILPSSSTIPSLSSASSSSSSPLANAIATGAAASAVTAQEAKAQAVTNATRVAEESKATKAEHENLIAPGEALYTFEDMKFARDDHLKYKGMTFKGVDARAFQFVKAQLTLFGIDTAPAFNLQISGSVVEAQIKRSALSDIIQAYADKVDNTWIPFNPHLAASTRLCKEMKRIMTDGNVQESPELKEFRANMGASFAETMVCIGRTIYHLRDLIPRGANILAAKRYDQAYEVEFRLYEILVKRSLRPLWEIPKRMYLDISDDGVKLLHFLPLDTAKQWLHLQGSVVALMDQVEDHMAQITRFITLGNAELQEQITRRRPVDENDPVLAPLFYEGRQSQAQQFREERARLTKLAAAAASAPLPTPVKYESASVISSSSTSVPNSHRRKEKVKTRKALPTISQADDSSSSSSSSSDDDDSESDSEPDSESESVDPQSDNEIEDQIRAHLKVKNPEWDKNKIRQTAHRMLLEDKAARAEHRSKVEAMRQRVESLATSEDLPAARPGTREAWPATDDSSMTFVPGGHTGSLTEKQKRKMAKKQARAEAAEKTMSLDAFHEQIRREEKEKKRIRKDKKDKK